MEKMNTEKIKELIKENRVHEFYVSPEWRRKSSEILRKQHNECQRCLLKGKYSYARTVHHKKYLRHRPDLAFEDDNLEAICDECHYEEHHGRGFATPERW